MLRALESLGETTNCLATLAQLLYLRVQPRLKFIQRERVKKRELKREIADPALDF